MKISCRKERRTDRCKDIASGKERSKEIEGLLVGTTKERIDGIQDIISDGINEGEGTQGHGITVGLEDLFEAKKRECSTPSKTK